jgi:hypothetical protein
MSKAKGPAAQHPEVFAHGYVLSSKGTGELVRRLQTAWGVLKSVEQADHELLPAGLENLASAMLADAVVKSKSKVRAGDGLGRSIEGACGVDIAYPCHTHVASMHSHPVRAVRLYLPPPPRRRRTSACWAAAALWRSCASTRPRRRTRTASCGCVDGDRLHGPQLLLLVGGGAPRA